MKYVITGGAGNISRPLALQLLEAGHEVAVIGRSEANLQPLVDKGARAIIGSVEDRALLAEAFTGADAVYTMVPPKFDVTDWKAYIGSIGENYAAAIEKAGVRYVVNLSSSGAHHSEGCGPVSGLYREEAALNTLDGVNIKHLRPGYFFANFLASINMVKHMHIIGSNFGGDHLKLVLSDTGDIAAAAARLLLQLDFTGKSVAYLASDERNTTEIANVLGTAIGNPDLPWVVFSDEQMQDGLLSAGLPPEIAKNYTELGAAIQSGKMFDDFLQHRPDAFGATKLEDFAKQFAEVYKKG